MHGSLFTPRVSRVLWFVGFPTLVALLLGQDASWDLRNYHLYNSHAWWTGRGLVDVAPAQLQSWHSPFLDLPLYAFARSGLLGITSTLWLTFPTIAALWALDRLSASKPALKESRAWPAVLSLCVMGGATSLQEVGTSMNDTFVAAAFLWALVLLTDAGASPVRRALLAGLLGGSITGLKLVAAPFCIALAVAALTVHPWRRAPSRLCALAAGGVLGMVLTFGPWAWETYHRFGNPVFPYFNDLYQSAWALPMPHEDVRFRADGFISALAAPLHLLTSSQRYGESIIADPRVLASIVIFGWLALRARSRDRAQSRNALALFLFCSVGTLIWALQYGVYRYTLPIEMLGGFAIATMLIEFRRVYAFAGVIVLIAVTDHPKQARLPLGQSLLPPAITGLHAGDMIVTANDEPLSYIALAVPNDVPWIALRNNFMLPDRCTALQRKAESTLYHLDGQAWLLRPADAQGDAATQLLADAYGVRVEACLDIDAPKHPLLLCPLSRSNMARVCGDVSGDQ
jgi:hypothetical protein